MTDCTERSGGQEGMTKEDTVTSVSIREVAPRDGLQNEEPIPTEAKVRLIDALSGTGVRRIEAVSFVHPKAIPQMADADEVWAQITRNPEIRYSALIPNTRGAQRALAAGFREIEGVVSGSDTHNRRNLNRSTDESLDDITGLIPLIHDAGAIVEVIVATSFGCPFEGDIAPERVAGIVARVRADGADRIAFGDTTGMASPRRVRDLLTEVRPDLLHFHNTRDLPDAWSDGLAAEAALQANRDLLAEVSNTEPPAR